MDARAEIREFLTSRRAKLQAADVGLPDFGPRRVPGLRREEVAVLAGVSAPYYTRLERGDLSGASDGVLEALAHALRLDEAERAHLFDLARNAQPVRRAPQRRPARSRLRPSVQQFLDAVTGAAVHVLDDRFRVVGANALGRAAFSPMFEGQEHPNTARFLFLDPRARDFYRDWDRIARDNVAAIRSVVGAHPHDRELTDLVGELSTRSEEFRQLWARHDVRFHQAGVKRFVHPEVGEMELTYERLDVAFDHGLTIYAYTAEAGTASAEALRLLGTLVATEAAERLDAAADDRG